MTCEICKNQTGVYCYNCGSQPYNQLIKNNAIKNSPPCIKSALREFKKRFLRIFYRKQK